MDLLWIALFSLPQGFFMDENEVNRRVPDALLELAESFELKAVAIWVTDTETELFFCDTDPDEEIASRLEILSQSFMEWSLLQNRSTIITVLHKYCPDLSQYKLTHN